jgi:DMSO/TMAO reductase YedYZ molybdopterin-dependent catalytic subunit
LLTILLAGLLLWHVLSRRFVWRIPAARDRRAFLRLMGVSLTGLLLWQVTEQAKAAANLSGANRRFTGSYERGSLTGHFPEVTWLFDNPPPVDLSRWRLTIEGAVAQPLTFTYEELTQRPTETVTATLDCTGGWYSAQEWRGLRLGDLLDQAGLTATARSLTVEAVSGYSRRFSLDQARDFLLALDVAGQPLSHGHGFPLRLVAPGERGFVWIKWVSRIRVNETSHLWQLPVPLR